MQSARKWICILLGALMLMSALSGCSRGKDSDEDAKLTVTACVCGPLGSLDPAANLEPEAESVFYAIYENLFRAVTDDGGRRRTEPGVAREYQAVENYDGTVDYTFTLRSSARWSDGTRVKAKDFVFAWRRLVDPAAELPNHAMLSMVKGYDAARETGDMSQLSIRAENDTTFRVTLSAPCPYFVSDICTAVATMPLRSDAVTDDGNWAREAGLPCNGPYQVAVWRDAESIRLSGNGSYYDRRSVHPEVIRFRFAEDAESAWKLYQMDRADYIDSPPAGTEGTLRVPVTSTCCVLYNHMSECFSNAQVRRAFDLALDRIAIAEAAGAEPATGLVPRGVVDASEDSEQDFRGTVGDILPVDAEGYAQRCADALRALGEAGQPIPELTCLYAAEDGAGATARAAAACWSRVLKVSVSTEELPREEFDRRVTEGEYDLAVDVLRPFGSDAMAYLELFSGTDGNNLLHYVNKPYDLLIGVASTARDCAARVACLHDAEELLMEDAALSPLWFGVKTCLLRETFTGVRHDPRGNAIFTGVNRSDTK